MESFTGVGYDIFVLRAHERPMLGCELMAMLGYVDDGLSSFFGTLLILRYPLQSYLSNPRTVCRDSLDRFPSFLTIQIPQVS